MKKEKERKLPILPMDYEVVQTLKEVGGMPTNKHRIKIGRTCFSCENRKDEKLRGQYGFCERSRHRVWKFARCNNWSLTRAELRLRVLCEHTDTKNLYFNQAWIDAWYPCATSEYVDKQANYSLERHIGQCCFTCKFKLKSKGDWVLSCSKQEGKHRTFAKCRYWKATLKTEGTLKKYLINSGADVSEKDAWVNRKTVVSSNIGGRPTALVRPEGYYNDGTFDDSHTEYLKDNHFLPQSELARGYCMVKPMTPMEYKIYLLKTCPEILNGFNPDGTAMKRENIGYSEDDVYKAWRQQHQHECTEENLKRMAEGKEPFGCKDAGYYHPDHFKSRSVRHCERMFFEWGKWLALSEAERKAIRRDIDELCFCTLRKSVEAQKQLHRDYIKLYSKEKLEKLLARGEKVELTRSEKYTLSMMLDFDFNTIMKG